MRILQVIDSLQTGGAEMMCVRIANELAKTDGRSYLIATRSLGGLQGQLDPRVIYECIDKVSALDLKALGKLFLFVLKHRISVIHAHSNSIFFGFAIKIIFNKVVLIWHDHYGDSENLGARKDYALRFISGSIDGVIAVNDKLMKWSKTRLKINNVRVINNIVDLGKYNFNPRIDYGNKVRIVLVANFRPQKNHKSAIEIFRRLNSIDPFKFEFVFVGNVVDERYFSSIRKEIESLGFPINLRTDESDSSVSIVESHICILTSKSEGMPLVLLEYAAIGRPIITTGVGQITDFFKDQFSCIICNVDETSKFVDSVIKISDDYGLRTKLVTNSRRVVEEHFSGQSFVDKYKSFISKFQTSSQ